ncbi:FprA family A-type flavoprotein [Acidilobus sp.]|uniref:FprA family A-type flavoprotein n=1 Tax=Acidilobus sp. TaxID=1872109 RepID=UPI003CFDC604
MIEVSYADLSSAVKVVDGVYWVGVNDTRKVRFENMWPIPEGISYNAYVIATGSGYVLVDGVEEEYTDLYLAKLSKVVEDMDKVKYIVVNHLEPDHQGSLEETLRRARNAKVLISAVGARMIRDFYDVPKDRVVPVKDGDRLEVDGKILRFIYTPWLHWPETMVTLDETDSVLLTCDVFGSYVALRGGLFDDQLEMEHYIEEAKRYYVNIVGRYTKNTIDALNKLSAILDKVKVIAPAHGPLYRGDPKLPVKLYYDWALPRLEPEVSILYISMYGHTVDAVKRLSDIVKSHGLRVRLIDAAEEHMSYALSYSNNSAAVLTVFPTYDASIPMPLNNILYTYQVKMFGRGRAAGVVTSYGWGPVAKLAADVLSKAGFRVVEPLVTLRTRPRKEELEALDKLGERIAEEVLKALEGGH